MDHAKTRRVNLGLAISGATLEPGKTRTLREIAAFCDCHWNAIYLIEQKAMKKLRHAILFGKHSRVFKDHHLTD